MFHCHRTLSGAAAPSNNTTRPFPPSAASEPHFGYVPKGEQSRFSFSKPPEFSQTRTYNDTADFLPAPNFDEFHASITSPQLSDFPSPSGSHSALEEAERTIFKSIDTAEPMDTEPEVAPRTTTETSPLKRVISTAVVAFSNS